MLRKFLEVKYGKYVTDKLVSRNNKTLLDNINHDGAEQQKQIFRHLKSLKDTNGKSLMPSNFLLDKEVKWGMDFSSWIGDMKKRKEYMFIGVEPHLKNNYQFIYGLGSLKGKKLDEIAQTHFDRKNDIWHNLTNIFVSDLTTSNISSFLNKCYITDLCHIVPKDCGQVKDICAKLSIKSEEWNTFRVSLAKQFLLDEIKIVNPKYVIPHGNVARDFFEKQFNVNFENEEYPIAGSTLKILAGELNRFRVISIPHLSGDNKSKLWNCKLHPERPISVKAILNKLIK